jgi:quinol monooxygenase YgiN
MTEKLRIVRLKPKPEHFNEFVQLLKARHENNDD